MAAWREPHAAIAATLGTTKAMVATLRRHGLTVRP
jgi:hypothetical protein